MKHIFIYVFLVLLFRSASTKSIFGAQTDTDELILVHTIFRHGNRTIDDGIYKGNPYGDEKYYKPFGYGQLTNEGKRTEYKLGQALRDRYDSFLGKEYNINLIDARTTNVNRTKMSLLLVLASLFPPSKDLLWNNELNWQPIPYNSFDNDKVLCGYKICKNYKKAYKKLIKSDEITKERKSYEKVFEYLSEHTEDDISTPKQVANLYMSLLTQFFYGYPIENWTMKYLSEMREITLRNFHYMVYTDKLKKLAAGYLIKKIIEDTENKIQHNSETKMYLYSGHEKNIGTILVTLGIFDEQVPSFGCYLLVEVHKKNDQYGFQFYYQNYKNETLIPLTIPECEEFCPLHKFKKLVEPYIPDEDDCEIE